MATGAVPVRIRTDISLFVENSHLETRHQGVMFRSPRAFLGSTATLRYEPCTQFINVSQRALHIYFIDGCRRIKIERNNLLCEQAPTEVFRSIFAWLVARLTFYLQLCGPLGQIPDLGSQAIVEFRLMADHENTSLVFFQCPFQLVFGIHIQMVRWLVQ